MGLFGDYIDQSSEQQQLDIILEDIQKKRNRLVDNAKLRNKCNTCTGRAKCELSTHDSFYIGHGGTKTLIVDVSPSRETQATKNHRTGFNYHALENACRQEGLDLDRDCWLTYAVRCPVTKVTDSLINSCRYKLYKTIRELNPEKIILMGGFAVKTFLGHKASSRVKTGRIETWAGGSISDQDTKAIILPIYNPATVEYSKLSSFVLKNESTHLLQKALRTKAEFRPSSYASECGYLSTEQEAIDWIKTCQNAKRISFDYETTGIKPHSKKQKILCLSLSNGLLSFGFKLYNSREFHSELAKLLMNPKIEKIAHNYKYEENWTRVKLGYKVKGWKHDPMLAAHSLDNRPGITSLKFQTYQAFGVMGYDNLLDPYMEATMPGDDPDSCNSRNLLEYAPMDELCKYCAEDSHYTYKLADTQSAHMDRHRQKGYGLFMQSTLNYVGMEEKGVTVSMGCLASSKEETLSVIETAEMAIANDPDVLRWKKARDEDFDYGSSEHLKHFIYEFQAEPVTKQTKKGAPSTDKEVLEGLASSGKSKVYGHIQLARKWGKVLEYIHGIEREVVDGVLHCFFNLNGVRSYRTSSNAINLQNIPKRDPQVKKVLRNIFVPLKGHRFTEYDFKAFEVSMYACYSQDETLMSYVTDLSKDMHRDMAAYIMKCSFDELVQHLGMRLAKMLRQETKSGFVFSQLYGAGADTCAQYFWDFFQTEDGAIIWEFFSSKTGMTLYAQWEEWIISVEDYFWNELFPKLGEWREQNWKKYIKSGRIKYLTGFFATGVMKKTQATNFPVQGTASNVKLMVMNELCEKLEKDGAKSKVFCEIHDSIVLDAVPEEADYLDQVMAWIVDVRIPELCPWANVPFYLEKSEGSIDGSWATVEEIGIING